MTAVAESSTPTPNSVAAQWARYQAMFAEIERRENPQPSGLRRPQRGRGGRLPWTDPHHGRCHRQAAGGDLFLRDQYAHGWQRLAGSGRRRGLDRGAAMSVTSLPSNVTYAARARIVRRQRAKPHRRRMVEALEAFLEWVEDARQYAISADGRKAPTTGRSGSAKTREYSTTRTSRLSTKPAGVSTVLGPLPHRGGPFHARGPGG
jgi:hypothetical protein